MTDATSRSSTSGISDLLSTRKGKPNADSCDRGELANRMSSKIFDG